MSYDPKACGAQCDLCPLKGQTVVPPEFVKDADVVIVGQGAGAAEERTRVPFAGPSGALLGTALREAGSNRGRVEINNAFLCRPPDDDYDKVLKRVKRQNRNANGAPLLLPPHVACRPRLLREIDRFDKVITLGSHGLRAVSGRRSSVLKERGGLQTHDRLVTEQERWRTFLEDKHPLLAVEGTEINEADEELWAEFKVWGGARSPEAADHADAQSGLRAEGQAVEARLQEGHPPRDAVVSR